MDNSAVKPIQLSGPVDCGNGKLQVWSFSEAAQTTFCNISGLPWTEAHLLLLGRLQTDSLNSGTSTWLGSSCCPQSHSQQLLGNYFVQKCIWSDLITCRISFCCLSSNTKQIDLLTFGGNIFWQVEGGMTLVSCWLVQCVYNVDNCNVTNAWYFYLYLTIFTCWYFTVCSRHSQPAGRCCWSLIEANWATTQEEVSYIIIIAFHLS